MALTTAVSGLVLVVHDADLGTLGLLEHLGGHGDGGEGLGVAGDGVAVDQQNVVLFLESNWVYGEEAAGATSLFFAVDGMQTADIALNGVNFTWAVAPPPGSGTSVLDLQAVLNEALLGQSGFVTCCCIRYRQGGELTVASAGHPAPFCDGRELEVAAGLPLGMVAEAEWQDTTLYLGQGSQVTLVSDGVVEAENAQRELFGFDRTREISGKSAREIAEAARAWGQNDDITVVTVTRRVA